MSACKPNRGHSPGTLGRTRCLMRHAEHALAHAPQRRCERVLAHAPLGLQPFVAKILYSFVVDQSVHHLAARCAFSLVHCLPDLHAPVGHDDRPHRIAADRGEHNAGECWPVRQRQDAAHKANLEHRRGHVEHQRAQHELNPAHAAFDVAGNYARLPRKVEREIEIVHVLKHLERYMPAPRRANQRSANHAGTPTSAAERCARRGREWRGNAASALA